MKQRELKQKMPLTAEFIEALCDAFGKESIHGQIRKGLNGEPVFHATENGHEIGTPVVHGIRVTWHPITGCAMDAED
jgi:hypothetical protein